IYLHSLFFYSDVHPQNLHSFPTRRSSDLSVIPLPPQLEALSEQAGQAGLDDFLLGGRKIIFYPPLFDHVLVDVVNAVGRAPVARSEEHTSELQSQSNLVCRLLLEKKK